MKRIHFLLPALLLASLFSAQFTNAQAQADPPVVRAVLFYSPSCGHCHLVINETLLPLISQYGDQLQIIALDITQPQGQTFFLAAMQKFNLEQAGVPFLVIGDLYLVGSLDIPEKFPGLVETYLAQGGMDWPDIPGLREAISQSPEVDAATATATSSQSDDSTASPPAQSATNQTSPEPATVISSPQGTPEVTVPITTPGLNPTDTQGLRWTDKFALDPIGNTLAVAILAGMLASVAWAAILFQKTNGLSLKSNWAWIIPVLCAVGFGVAGYLAYVETAQVTAVCGPVGDCNTVQQSQYARLFGILPIGVLGLIGYIIILFAWLAARYGNGRLAGWATLSMLALTGLGTLFSIYLTFLEPFVIGATCAWCLTSAILMTLLMLLSVGPTKMALSSHLFITTPHRRGHSQIGDHND